VFSFGIFGFRFLVFDKKVSLKADRRLAKQKVMKFKLPEKADSSTETSEEVFISFGKTK
jgi:hypothetical protein